MAEEVRPDTQWWIHFFLHAHGHDTKIAYLLAICASMCAMARAFVYTYIYPLPRVQQATCMLCRAAQLHPAGRRVLVSPCNPVW
jgi:hypothetical protein